MDQCNTTPGTLVDSFYYAQISQTVDTTGCNVLTDVGELTGGTYNMTTRNKAGGDDLSMYAISFYDVDSNFLASSSATTTNGDALFHTGSFSGPIPDGADTVTVMLGGQGVPGSDPNPGVYHDNVVYEFTSCIAAYAVAAGKSSCTAGNEPSGGGDGNEQWIPIDECPTGPSGNFADFIEAQIGLLDGTGGPFPVPYSGTPTPGTFLEIEGKFPDVQQWCHLTPSGSSVATIDADGAMVTAMDYECDIGGTPYTGTGITVTLMNPASDGRGRDKDRGYVNLLGPVFGDYTVPFRRGMVYTDEN